MDIEVLGPFVVRHHGVSLTPTPAKPRTVYAMLALNANEVVSADALIEELWGGKAPRTARTTLQTYVLHLRKLTSDALPAAPDGSSRDAKQILATRPGGYMLNITSDGLDVWRFERLTAAGHRAREMGDFLSASRNFADALQLWRGRALVDVQIGPQLALHVRRLEEMRLNVLDRRIDADLRLGRHHELLGDLSALVSQYRTHEGLCAHYMLALHRSGRRYEATEVYHRLRARLAEDLGLDPSPPLQQLHRSILLSDQGSKNMPETPPLGPAA